MKVLITVMMLFVFIGCVKADKYHPHPHIVPEVTVPVTLDVNEVTNVNEIANYTYDDCQGVAMAMAVGNNQMYMGTNKLQVSGGAGVCEGNWAGSVMAGVKVTNNMFINGNFAFDDEVNAGGFGATWVFK